ncbi:MAG TPA: M36 family metallopeptidase [Pyrinomonadaceae bacterium]
MKRRPPTTPAFPRRPSPRKLLPLFAAAFFAFSLSWNFPARVSSQGSDSRAQAAIDIHPAGPENFDLRTSRDKAAQIKRERYQQSMSGERAQKRLNRGQQLKTAGDRLKAKGARVEKSEYMDAPEVVSLGKGGRMRAAAGESRDRVVRRFLAANEGLYGLSSKQVGRLRKRADYTNPAGNLSWVSLEQSFHDIPVFQGELTAALTPDGELVHTSGLLAPDVNEKELDRSPDITAEAAIASAAATVGLTVEPGAMTLKESDGASFVYSGGPFTDDTKIELVYFPLDSGVAALAWAAVLHQDPAAYYAVVDANDGGLLFRKNMTNDQTQPATYVVYGSDSPAPLSPNLNLLSLTVPTNQGAAVGRDTFTLIHQHPSLNDPWLNDGDNTTVGNNVDAGLDLAAPDGIEPATRPVGAPTRVFDFPYNPAPGIPPPGDAPTLANYRSGEVVNMFYWTNRFHDITYGLGFTEAARNFQQNNFGRGGLGNDRVLAQGQDSSGTDNANFLTLPDGTPGRMQMYIFTGPTPRRSSGLDQEIIIHELTHGLSNRLHGNATGLNFAQGGGMGEGWGDFYARAILSTADEDLGGLYAAGGYATLQITGPAYLQNGYYGIRRFPYALRSTLGANGRPHNPLTLADVDASKINLTDGAFPRGPIGSATAHQVHNVGEVWCSTLLEVRARLIALHGFAVGNQRALQLVTDGMKLEPADPTLLQARDAILAASAASGGGAAEERAIWEGFAARGMGFGATVSAASSAPITVTESFDTPNLLLGAVAVENDACDVSGFADPGEAIELAVQITNPLAGTDAENVTAEIVGGGSAGYGTIPGGGNVTRNLTYTVPATALCGDKITLTININSSLGPVTKTHVLQVGAPTSIGSVVSASTGNVSIPLPDVATTEIPINVADSGFVGDVNVRFRLNHSFDGDLEIRLIAPDGTAVLLADNRGGSGDNFGTGANDCSGTQTLFDDSAAALISAGVAPFANSFRPESPLAALNGKQMNGVWKLRITDTGAADVGTLGCASLEIQPQLYFCCGVPGTPIVNAAPPATVVAESVVPANNAPDPDETVTMSFPLKNVGTGLTSNLVATLLPGGGVNAPSGPQSYGAISPIGPAVARDFTFVPSGSCGGNITATLQLQDGPLNLGTVSYTIRLGSTVVGGASGANTTSIAVPGAGTGASTGAPANPYPSAINISGVTGTVTKVTATLHGFSHTFPSDVDVLLVGPGGQTVMLMSDAGGSLDAVNTTLTFDDAAPAVGTNIVSGTFRPTNVGTADPFPAPAPAAPHGTQLAGFNGISPNGAWRLFVVDDLGTDSGSVAGGWSLTIVTADPLCLSSPCTIGAPDVVQSNDAGACGAFVHFPTPTITGSCGVLSYSPPSGSFFPVGLTPVSITGTLQDNSAVSGSCNVTINDAEQPSIGGGAVSRPSLWPANHKMVDVAVNYTVGDNCTAAGAITRSLGVASNEPVNGTGDGDTAPDWQVVGPNLVRLRAERSGNGSGRIYTITIKATDAHGNSSSKDVFVSVPHDQ